MGETLFETPACQSDTGDGSPIKFPLALWDCARGDLGAYWSLRDWDSGITKPFDRPEGDPGRDPHGVSLDAGERREGEGVLW